MYCQQCQQEVVTAKNPHTGALQCSQCGTEKADSPNQDTIAQTAHALLKRWEASRSTETIAQTAAQNSIESESALAFSPEQGTPGHVASGQAADDGQLAIGQDISDELEPPKPPATPLSDFARSASQADLAETMAKFANGSSGMGTPNRTPQDQQAAAAIHQDVPDVAKTTPNRPAVQKPLAARNDAFSLMKSNRPTGEINDDQKTDDQPAVRHAESPTPAATQQLEQQLEQAKIRAGLSSAPPKQKQVEKTNTEEKGNAISSGLAPSKPEPEPIEPRSRRTADSRRAAEPRKVTESPSRSTTQGHVRFAATPTEIEDYTVQQAIEQHHRKQKNWSALLGQFLAFTGAMAMTGGIAVVIGNRFGSLEVAETTGWLCLAGGHLLFIMGIYTHLTSRIEQVWHDLHQRSDDIQRLIEQQQRTQQQLLASMRPQSKPGSSPRPAASASQSESFQRDSLAHAS